MKFDLNSIGSPMPGSPIFPKVHTHHYLTNPPSQKGAGGGSGSAGSIHIRNLPCSVMGVLGVLGCPNPYPSQTPAHSAELSPNTFFSTKNEYKGQPKKEWKTEPSKNYFFHPIFGLSELSLSNFHQFWVNFGTPRRLFFDFFGRSNFQSFFSSISQKNMLFSRFRRFRKNTDPMQGSLQNAWFWQGGKMRGRLGKTIDFSSQISSKIDEKSSKKSRWTQFAAKVDKIAFPGTFFLGKSRFWVVLGTPGGTQKLQKTSQKLVGNSLGGTPWSYFLPLHVRSLLEASFLVLRRVSGSCPGTPEARFWELFGGIILGLSWWSFC